MDKAKLLYVEDEAFLGKIVQESLESRNFEVCMESDGDKVIDKYHQFQPDLCILDVMLPNRNGFSIGEEIRQLNPTIPIIYLTAKNQTTDLVKGFASGGNDYIKKPFSMEELIVRINNLLHLVSNQTTIEDPNAGLQLGQYTFYPKKFELHTGDHIRKLSHRETELLKILANNRNFTVQRKEILKKIWGDDSFFNSRNLDVYITKLRDYLKEDEKVKIVTLKGVGYHFVVE